MSCFKISLEVNGAHYERNIPARMTLVDFLREELDLTGTHVGCEHGVCGACTALLDGKPIRTCIMLAVQADGHSITTVEGLGHKTDDGRYQLTEVQKAFWECHGMQCGYCTPGMLMTATALLNENPNPAESEIREAVSGNICRCTGYQQIVESVQMASRNMVQNKALNESKDNRQVEESGIR